MNRQRLLLTILFVFALTSCEQERDAVPATDQPVGTSATAGVPVPTENGGAPAYPAGDEGYPGPGIYSQVITPAYPGAVVIDPNAIVTRAPESALDPDRPVPTPQPSMATATGYVVSAESGDPFVNVAVRLAEVYYNEEGIATFILDGANSPGALTDINGRFIFAAVDAAEYVIVVGNVETNNYDIIEASSGNAAEVWEMPADEVTDVGTLRVDLPVP